MGKRVRTALAVMVLAVVAVAVVPRRVSREREPQYGGKPISYWIDRSGEEYEGSGFPCLPLSVNDSNAVPFLINALKRRPRSLSGLYSRTYWSRGLPFSLRNRLAKPVNANQIREIAAMHLGLMGPVAKPAVPALLSSLKADPDPMVRAWAARSLLGLGSDDGGVVETALRALNGEPFSIRLDTAYFVLGFDPSGSMTNAIVGIAKCLGSADKSLREAATNALLRIDPIAAAQAGVNTNTVGH